MKSVGPYLRVSTEDQAKEGYSLEVQREYLESFAKREGFEIFKVYQDDDISGYSTDRPAFKELLKDAKEKRFDLVFGKGGGVIFMKRKAEENAFIS
jgi:site-specific DNA recombinase